jgi:hypothetical protein
MANDNAPTAELEPREPTVEDLRDLCRALNDCGALYIVVGGFAIRAAGFILKLVAAKYCPQNTPFRVIMTE